MDNVGKILLIRRSSSFQNWYQAEHIAHYRSCSCNDLQGIDAIETAWLKK